ncbi:MAG TPA: hypothetical protein VFX93_14485, partial [Xanthomonadaceae bacterium]|nr:hypothetical protein [Xanthomonadaceae bacterium]
MKWIHLGAFFGYFLCTSKESNSPSGESSVPKNATSVPATTQVARRSVQLCTRRSPSSRTTTSAIPGSV